jgi:hypothetical protein
MPPNSVKKKYGMLFDYYAALRPAFDKMAANYSALLTRSATDEAPLGIEDIRDPIFNFVWTVRNFELPIMLKADRFVQAAHMPVVHVPASVGHNACLLVCPSWAAGIAIMSF